MKIITDIKEANNLLKSYMGATLQIVMYSESLKRIAIRLSLPNVIEVVYLVGISCESINSRFSFLNANLGIVVDIDKETKDNKTRIKDKISGFELITSGGVTLAQGLESDFGISFDDFFSGKG
jgi:hypothetical protein